ncbi:MAG: MFS transporter [Bacillota bacterium]|jgi:AAHS family 4-hydroxybenzoate transporter-like MFS transporter|nr:MFS transporter [Bacillota bacterium]
MEANSARTLEISQLIDQRKLSSLQITVIVLSALVVWLDGYHIQSMALIVPALSAQWGVESSGFSMVLASALLGIAIGGAFLAPLGDRFGRRILLIVSTVLLGLMSIGTSFASNTLQLLIWRFLTGLMLGTSMTNATALTSEYLPGRRRAALVTLMFSGVSIGAFTSGFVAPVIIENFGWKGVFTIGGAVPLLLSVVLAAALPESIKLLLSSRPKDPRIAKILARLAPGIDPLTVYVKKQVVQKQSVAELLSKTYRKGTLLLWMVFIFNMFVLYLLVNWLPTLLTTQGWSASQASKGAVMIQAGGVVGGLVLSWCVDKGKTVGAMLAAYIVAAAALGLFTILPASGPSWWVLLVMVGCGVSGTQFVLNALSAIYYPPLIRATGIGWAGGIGRIGAVLSPMVGGWIIKMEVAPFAVLGMLVIPVAICAIGVLMFRSTFKTAPEH